MEMLGKYAPQGSRTAQGGYVLFAVGVILFLANGPLPVLAPIATFLIEAQIIEPETDGVLAITAGFFAITGRAAFPDRGEEK